MNTGQALQAKATAVKALRKARTRLIEANAYTVVDGVEHFAYSPEEYAALQAEITAKEAEVLRLRLAIDKANHNEFHGTTIQELIIRKAELIDRHAFIGNLGVGELQPSRNRWDDDDGPKQLTRHRLTRSDRDAAVDALEAEIDEINNRINGLNASISVQL